MRPVAQAHAEQAASAGRYDLHLRDVRNVFGGCGDRYPDPFIALSMSNRPVREPYTETHLQQLIKRLCAGREYPSETFHLSSAPCAVVELLDHLVTYRHHTRARLVAALDDQHVGKLLGKINV